MRTAATVMILMLAAGTAQAQSFTPRMLGQVAGKSEVEKGDFNGIAGRGTTAGSEERGKANDVTASAGVAILSQADVLVDDKSAQVGLQALDLFFNKDWRLYLRSTLPVPDTDTAASAETASAPKLSSSAVSALLDPYGGVLNLSTGTFKQIPIGKVREGQRDPDHGLFVDARFGLKMVNLPDQSEEAPSLLNTSVSPFYSGVMMFKIIKNVFPSADERDAAGGFEFGIGAVVNVAADKNASKSFANGLLADTTTAVRCDVALNLKSVAAITIGWTPWSSNEGLGKRFVVGLKLLNQNPMVK